MRMDSRGAVETSPCASPAADGFVILMLGIPEGEVVHGGLPGRQCPGRTKKRRRDCLRRFHIAGHHCRRIGGVQETALWYNQFEGIKTAVVEGDIILYEASEHVEYSRSAHGQRGVKIGRYLTAGAGKVDLGLARGLVHGDADLDGAAMIQGEFE